MGNKPRISRLFHGPTLLECDITKSIHWILYINRNIFLIFLYGIHKDFQWMLYFIYFETGLNLKAWKCPDDWQSLDLAQRLNVQMCPFTKNRHLWKILTSMVNGWMDVWMEDWGFTALSASQIILSQAAIEGKWVKWM